MSTLFSKEYQVNILGGTFNGKYYSPSVYYLKYRIDVILNSQDTAQLKSNITVKVYGMAGNASYSGNNYVKLSVTDGTNVLVVPTKITRNDFNNYTEYEALRYTADYPHNADGTLAVRFDIVFDHTTSTNVFVPQNTTISTGAVAAPTIDVGSPYSVLHIIGAQPVTGKFGFEYDRAVNASKHTLQIKKGGTLVKQQTEYESGALIELTTTQLLNLITATDEPYVSLTASLQTFDAGGTSLGTDTKTFDAMLTSAYVTDGTVVRAGYPWVNDAGTYKKGLLWIKDNGEWKRGEAT